MLCKNCEHVKTISVGSCFSSRSFCKISSGSVSKGTKLGVILHATKPHPKCPLKVRGAENE